MTQRILIALIVLALSACATASNSDRESNIDLQQRQSIVKQGSVPSFITAGLTHFRFKNWKGPMVPVWVYVPWNVDPETAPIMVLMHGAKRAPARYLSEWDQVAEAKGFIIIAPEFTKKSFPKSAKYNLGNMYQGKEMHVNPEEKWSFSAIEPIFDEVVNALNGQQKNYTLYGHSAGSQFTHRYMFFKPDARVKRFLPANAGWYTMPDLTIPYPYGLGGTDITEEELKSVLQKDVVVLLGDADNDSSHNSLRRTEEAMAQGAHRFARGNTFFEAAKAAAKKYNVEFAWKLRVIENVGHSNGGIAIESGDLIE